MDEFDGLLDAQRTGAVSNEAYIAGLQRLAAREPKLTDFHAPLAFIFLE